MASEPQAAVLGGPVQAEPAALADLAAERRQLTALEFQTMLGHLGPQRGRDVVFQKTPHLGQPCPLLVVELEIHNGDISRRAPIRYRRSRKVIVGTGLVR